MATTAQSAVCWGNVPMRKLLAGQFRPDGDMLLLWSACLTWGNRCRTSRFQPRDQHKGTKPTHHR